MKQVLYLLIGLSLCLSLNNNEVISITYDSSVKRIIQDNCISCHSGDNPAANMSLETYKNVKCQAEKGQLLNRIDDKMHPMPMGGLMPKETREKIKLWAQNGFKEFSDSNLISKNMEQLEYTPPTIHPIDISEKGFEFMELMKGHWVGAIMIMGQNYDWFSFDYRPISSSHIFGIYEGGTMGNLMTSFFITNFKGKRTIMARNGGILNGIYRMSYFVLDKVEVSKNEKYFRFVDAYGGKDIMWMELSFKNDKIKFHSYTSRFGTNHPPKLHMEFSAKKMHEGISDKVAKNLNFPQNIVDKDFAEGLKLPKWGDEYPVITSYSYMHRAKDISLEELGALAGDPYPIQEIPYISTLKVEIEQNENIEEEELIIYLSKEPLTDEKGNLIMEYGYMKIEVFNGIFHFPNLKKGSLGYLFEYLHPGKYYITVVADKNKNGFASKGDLVSVSKKIVVSPKSKITVKVDDVNHQN